MTTAISPVAPAQGTVPPVTISATKDAATRGDFAAFERADLAAREGKPLAEVPPGEAAAAEKRPNARSAGRTADDQTQVVAIDDSTAQPDNRRTREQKEQDRINESIRTATDAATASLRAEIATLRSQLGERPAAATRPAVEEPPKGTPEWKRYAALPDAPKIDDFDSVADHTAAMSFFIAKTMLGESRAESQAQTAAERATLAEQDRFDAFQTRIDARKTKDPDWSGKLSPEVRALKPFGALDRTKGERGGPANVVCEQVINSPIADEVLLYLSEHGDVLTSLVTMPEAIARMGEGPAQRSAHTRHIVTEVHRLEGRLMSTAAAPGASAPAEAAASSPITKAPPPADTITRARSVTDPREAALTKGDFAAFDRIEQEKERQKRERR